MLTTPNMQSSGNDNDSSDDFAIININTPSPQPLNDSNNNKLASSISQLKESEEVDDFEHLSMMNVAKTPNSSDDSNTSAEQSDFDLIDIALKESPSDRDPITAEAARDSVVSDKIDKPSKVILPSEKPESEPADDIIGETVISPMNLADIEAEQYGEQKIDTLQLSPSISPRSESSSPKATMDEIVTLTEPFNSSLSSANDAVSDGPIFVNQENQPLIETGVKGKEINEKKRKNSYLKKEYERYVLDQRSDERAGMNGFLCCRYNNNHDNEQQVNEARDFFDSIACIVDFLGGYVDKCFGADQFNDDCGPRKPYKEI